MAVTGYVELGEVRTWYAEYGQGEPLVLLHPGGADARSWAPTLDALAAHFHIFTPERRGHGRTPGRRRSDHLRENFELFDFELDPGDLTQIDALGQGDAGRIGPEPGHVRVRAGLSRRRRVVTSDDPICGRSSECHSEVHRLSLMMTADVSVRQLCRPSRGRPASQAPFKIRR